MSEETIPYARIAIKIGVNRVGFIELPKDVTATEIKAFIRQCKQIKQK